MQNLCRCASGAQAKLTHEAPDPYSISTRLENGDISSELVDERDQVATAGVRGRERTNHIGMNYVTGAGISGNRASKWVAVLFSKDSLVARDRVMNRG
jgi:hypothetical protein